MAALLAVPSEPEKNSEGFKHLMATSLLCHLPRYTCRKNTLLKGRQVLSTTTFLHGNLLAVP